MRRLANDDLRQIVLRIPLDLAETCVRAGSCEGDLVLDPFAGSGTVSEVCARLGRGFDGIELNPEYAEMARRRSGR